MTDASHVDDPSAAELLSRVERIASEAAYDLTFENVHKLNVEMRARQDPADLRITNASDAVVHVVTDACPDISRRDVARVLMTVASMIGDGIRQADDPMEPITLDAHRTVLMFALAAGELRRGVDAEEA